MSTGSIVALLLLVGSAVLVAVCVHNVVAYMRRKMNAEIIEASRHRSSASVTRIGRRP